MMQAQDDWCEAAAWQLGQAGNDTAHRLVSSRFPEELEVDLIVGLLRGQVKLHNHCYETYDLEMMIRNSHQ